MNLYDWRCRSKQTKLIGSITNDSHKRYDWKRQSHHPTNKSTCLFSKIRPHSSLKSIRSCQYDIMYWIFFYFPKFIHLMISSSMWISRFVVLIHWHGWVISWMLWHRKSNMTTVVWVMIEWRLLMMSILRKCVGRNRARRHGWVWVVLMMFIMRWRWHVWWRRGCDWLRMCRRNWSLLLLALHSSRNSRCRHCCAILLLLLLHSG